MEEAKQLQHQLDRAEEFAFALDRVILLSRAGENDIEELFTRLMSYGWHELTVIDAIDTVMEWAA